MTDFLSFRDTSGTGQTCISVTNSPATRRNSSPWRLTSENYHANICSTLANTFFLMLHYLHSRGYVKLWSELVDSETSYLWEILGLSSSERQRVDCCLPHQISPSFHKTSIRSSWNIITYFPLLSDAAEVENTCISPETSCQHCSWKPVHTPASWVLGQHFTSKHSSPPAAP